jgi:uncharacterized membrane protein
VHPLLLEELATARIDELRRQATRERRVRSLQRPSLAAQVARRCIRGFGFLLVGAGLRLAAAGDSRHPPARRGVA